MDKQRSIELPVSQSNFNLIWCALHDREKRLLRIIEHYGEDSDEAAHAGNEIVGLRLYMKSLKGRGEGVFFPSAFILDDTPVD